MSDTISSFLTQDHRDCDEILAQLENAVNNENWTEVQELSKDFFSHMQDHFAMEEEIMFPVFEQKTGMSAGPTQVMRMEHAQMSQVMQQMQEDINNKNKEHFFGLSETLMMLIQQHNMKEEQMLYRMADAHLAEEASLVVTQMKELKRA